jgi:hypothetical protein
MVLLPSLSSYVVGLPPVWHDIHHSVLTVKCLLIPINSVPTLNIHIRKKPVTAYKDDLGWSTTWEYWLLTIANLGRMGSFYLARDKQRYQFDMVKDDVVSGLKRRIGEWRYSSTHSLSRHEIEVSGQLHTPVALLPRKETPVSTGEKTVWDRTGLDAVANEE